MIESTVSPKSLLENAIGLGDAVEVLVAKRQNSTVYAIGILAAHALEISLKGYLLCRDFSEKKLKEKKIRHNLIELWKAAVEKGLSIEADPPYWVQVLNFSHNEPYYFRYPPHEFGVGVPDVDKLVRDLKNVIAVIEAIVFEK